MIPNEELTLMITFICLEASIVLPQKVTQLKVALLNIAHTSIKRTGTTKLTVHTTCSSGGSRGVIHL